MTGDQLSGFIIDMSRGIYRTARWQRLRARVLKRDGYMCQVSKRYGRQVEATTVHHIFPASQYPEYQWCDWNLISLSASAHDKMHDRNTNELTELGMELVRRVARERGIDLHAPRS